MKLQYVAVGDVVLPKAQDLGATSSTTLGARSLGPGSNEHPDPIGDVAHVQSLGILGRPRVRSLGWRDHVRPVKTRWLLAFRRRDRGSRAQKADENCF